MQNFWLLLLALVSAATPLSAQTVSNPMSKQPGAAPARDRTDKEASAQALTVSKMDAVNESGSVGYDIVAFDSRSRLVRGTPFVVAGWAMGEVVMGTSLKPMSGIFKFDTYNQQLRALRAQGDSIILSPERTQRFTIWPTGKDGKPVERRFERLPEYLIADKPIAFAEDISTGDKLRLLKFHYKNIIKGQAGSSYGNGHPVDAFNDNERYYLRWADDSYVFVKPNKASILQAIAVKQPAAIATELQDKTKARSDEELGTLVQRINNNLADKADK